jgi:predicted amidohydrolase
MVSEIPFVAVGIDQSYRSTGLVVLTDKAHLKSKLITTNESSKDFIKKISLAAKISLDIFDEVRYFESAKEVRVLNFKGEVLGLSICEDIWNDADYWKHRLYEKDPVQRLVDKGSTVLINLSFN